MNIPEKPEEPTSTEHTLQTLEPGARANYRVDLIGPFGAWGFGMTPEGALADALDRRHRNWSEFNPMDHIRDTQLERLRDTTPAGYWVEEDVSPDTFPRYTLNGQHRYIRLQCATYEEMLADFAELEERY